MWLRKVLPKPVLFAHEGDKAELVEKSVKPLLFKIMSYAQGFAQLRVASKENNWNLPFAKSQKIYVRLYHSCSLLQKITDAYGRDEDLGKLAFG